MFVQQDRILLILNSGLWSLDKQSYQWKFHTAGPSYNDQIYYIFNNDDLKLHLINSSVFVVDRDYGFRNVQEESKVTLWEYNLYLDTWCQYNNEFIGYEFMYWKQNNNCSELVILNNAYVLNQQYSLSLIHSPFVPQSLKREPHYCFQYKKTNQTMQKLQSLMSKSTEF